MILQISHILVMRLSPYVNLSSPSKSPPFEIYSNAYVTLLIDNLPSIPLSAFSLLRPSYIIFGLLSTLLPLVDLFLGKSSRAQAISTLLFPTLPVS